MKLFLKIILSVVAIMLLVGIGGTLFLIRGLEKESNIIIDNISISSLEDGVYNGEHKAGRWSNKVEVIVKNHKIDKVNLIEDVLFSKPEVAEELFSRVVKNQSINVDEISGATATSKAYLKAIETALKNK
ncbi:FMN-binding protein [Clostridium bovifaecis]|uniref:FMN-binding protein n=1 Tax=Clostridium bovifaecis TaxID=2184719 RepID=A0A6I6ES80_9CLOT|nr:FMN-binding protein [Clostridium bovifaecis]